MAQLELVQSTAQNGAFSAPKPQARANSAAFGSIQLSVSHSLGESETMWRKLEVAADLTPFQSFDWLSTWQEHIGQPAGVLPVVIIGGPAESPLFVLPLAIRQRGFLRELVFLADELNDYNAPIVARDFAKLDSEAFGLLWTRITRLLQDSARTRHHLVRFTKMPERIGRQSNPLLALGAALHPSGAYATALAGDWQTYYKAKRSSKTQRQDRLKRKHLSADGEARLVTATTPADIDRVMDALIRQKEASLATMGAANMFAGPGRRAFYAAIAKANGGELQPHVCGLGVGDTLLATNMGLRFRGTYYYILASYDDGPMSRYGPGTIQLQDLMANAIAAGDSVFDFTIGDERYKREWCEIETALYDHVSSDTIVGRVAVTLASLKRAGKRTIKQSSWLWPLAQKVRAKLGGLRG